MAFRPISSQNSYGQNWNEVNNMVRQLNKEQQVKTFKGPNNVDAVRIGKLGDGVYGIQFSDGVVTTTITAASIVQNDGTHDRLFLGNEGD